MDKSETGRRLISLRGDRSQEAVAEAIGVSRSALVMYETGKRVPRDEIKIRLAKYYGVSIQSLFYNQDDTKYV